MRLANPCPSCVALDDCRTCLPRLQWEATQLTPEPRPCVRCADIRLLLDAGEHLPRIAERLGVALASVERHCWRHGIPVPTHLRRYAS